MSDDADNIDDPVAYAEECEARAEEATDGPWEAKVYSGEAELVVKEGIGGPILAYFSPEEWEHGRRDLSADGLEFIAHARTDVPASPSSSATSRRKSSGCGRPCTQPSTRSTSTTTSKRSVGCSTHWRATNE